MRESMRFDEVAAASTSNSHPRSLRARGSRPRSRQRMDNVFWLVAHRELVPRKKHCTRRFWGESVKGHDDSFGLIREAARDARHALVSWVEAESLRHLSAKYCPLSPSPRSTIAASFSPDGKTLASTHGDHTVKIIDCYSRSCLKVLSGHRRTPWVVRFHPLCPEIVASGSLDHEVRLWDASTGECIASKDFYRPIASIAFHAQGEVLAVASGHKLFIWHYSRRGETSEPAMVLKTRRSLRAVLFHPHAAPFLLTAEVNDLDSSNSVMSVATSEGYLRYPPATLDDGMMLSQHTDGHVGSGTGQQRLGSRGAVRQYMYSTYTERYNVSFSPFEANNESSAPEERTHSLPDEMDIAASEPAVDATDTVAVHPEERKKQFFPFGDPDYLYFLQGLLAGQGQGESRMLHPQSTMLHENSPVHSEMAVHDSLPPLGMPISVAYDRSSHAHPSRSHIESADLNIEVAAVHGPQVEENDTQSASRIQSELATSLTAAAAAELPCTVKLRIWPHNIKDSCAVLAVENCRLTIPYAVLCSEMGAHFSPCGRFLAACVACVLPHLEGDLGLQVQTHNDGTGASTSPTRHPLSAHQVIYELRIYSLEEATFGMVLASRPVRAAHCLTSIQFSPTSEHVLLAYGRRHGSLLQSIVTDGETSLYVYTVLEVYRVSDMELVKVLPSAEDEVNVACFHPSVGQGLVYGTKEGKLRVLQPDSSVSFNCFYCSAADESMVELPPSSSSGSWQH